MHTDDRNVSFSDDITAELPVTPTTTYFSVVIPYVSPLMATKWHPTFDVGAFSSVVRGAFKSEDEAIVWARKNLNGNPYSVRRFDVGATPTQVRRVPTPDRDVVYMVQYVDKFSPAVTFVWAKSEVDVRDAFECQVGLRDHTIHQFREAEPEDIALFINEYEKAADRMLKEQM